MFGEIVIKGKDVSVTIPIQFSGTGATSENITKTVQGIESKWSGKIGAYNVTTTVEVVPSSSNRKTNKVELVDGEGTSNVTNSITGVWYTQQSFYGSDYYPKTAAHEAGHLIGAIDQYTESKDSKGNRETPPKVGYEKNIMATLNGVVEERTIMEIITSKKNSITGKSPESGSQNIKNK